MGRSIGSAVLIRASERGTGIQGRDQPLADTIASALSTATAPGTGQILAALEVGSEQYSRDRA